MTQRTSLNTRKGIIYMRWRGAEARAANRSPDPALDRDAAQAISHVDGITAPLLIGAFVDGYHRADRLRAELAYERQPYSTRQQSRKIRSANPQIPYSNPGERIFHWYGQLAFAKGVDRSPSHDRQAAKRLKGYANVAVLPLIRAWEAGWDDAYDSSMEISLERRSILETPRVFNARHIRRASSNIKKE